MAAAEKSARWDRSQVLVEQRTSEYLAGSRLRVAGIENLEQIKLAVFGLFPPRYNLAMKILITAMLFAATAIAEILGCYLPYLWLRHEKSPWLVVPAAGSLAIFVWLLTLHPSAAGRVYAAYGGMDVSIALVWLWLVDGVRPERWDYVGVALCLTGMGVIMFAPRG